MLNWLQKLPRLLDLCLATPCPLCERTNSAGATLSASVLCFDCQRQIQQCQASSSAWEPPLPQFAWGEYRGALKRSLTVLKYNNQPQLARPLGQWLAQGWLAIHANQPAQIKRGLIVVPVPLHPTKQQQRGFNQAELLAEAFCEWTGLNLQRQGIVRVRSTEAQHNLSAAERSRNLEQAFAVDRSRMKHSSPVLLVDDIYTTGATARAIQQVLQQEKIPLYGIVTVAQSVRTQL